MHKTVRLQDPSMDEREERKENEKIMGIEPSTVELEAKDAGLSVAEYIIKQLNSMLDANHLQLVLADIQAKVDSGGFEYRAVVSFPDDELSLEELQPLLTFATRQRCMMWIGVGPKQHLQAVYIWERPTRNARIGEEPNQGR